MEVIVYTRPDCESSRRIKEILENRGVAFQEHVCADGKLDGKDLRNLDIDVKDVPLTVVDGLVLFFGLRIPFLGRLPGDISVDRGSVHFYFPIVTSLLLSLILTLLLNLFFRR